MKRFDSTSGVFTGIWEGVTAVSPTARDHPTYLDVLSQTKNSYEPTEAVSNSLPVDQLQECHLMGPDNGFSVKNNCNSAK